MPFTITVDTGGTFSDLVLADSERILDLSKAPTTPDDVFEGVHEALKLAAASQGLGVDELLANTTSFVYATTVSTNAMLEGRTARTALLTTAGHRDVLLYREGGKSDPLNINVPYPPPYVPRSLTFPVFERTMADGTITAALDETRLHQTVERLRELAVEAVGVCLLWSIVNPVHEARVGEILRDALPEVELTLSHTLNPIIREYRRASATVIDASLKPLMRVHLHDVDRRLRELGFRGEPLLATHLSGGVVRLDEMCEQPLHSVDSGPALAPIGGLAYAAAEASADDLDVLVVDAGGTSLDISPTRDRRVVYTREKWFGPKWEGHLTGLPAVETRSVGAGGGSIASVDSGGYLSVGPLSAGADPGPACYGRGGTEPTVTDAAVVLGYIDPEYFLGGQIRLQSGLSRAVLEQSVAAPLDLSIEGAAEAILTVFSERTRAFISEMTINQGLDPRRCLLVAGGGASGLNVVTVARELGVPKVLVPTMAAGLSAVGGQYADIVATTSRALRTTSDAFDFEGVNAVLTSISADMRAFVDRVDAPGAVRHEYFCEARYANQLWELDVPLGERDRFDSEEDVESLSKSFDALHEAVFAVNQPGEQLETVTWRGEVRIARPAPSLAVRHDARRRDTDALAARTRDIWIDGSWTETPVHPGTSLVTGTDVEGPAIIEEPTTTILLITGSVARVRPGHYLIETGA